MIRPKKIPNPAKAGVGGWSRALQHLDDALQKNCPSDYSEQIQILGRHMFGDLWSYNPPSNSNHS